MKVGIAGVGGIGSNVAMNLVRSGVLQLKIADFDSVETSNLNRQFYFTDQIGSIKVRMLAENLKRIHAAVTIEPLMLKLDETNILETFQDCDAVVEGFDAKICKATLLEALADSGKLVVSACGIAGSTLDQIHTRKIGNCYVVGDFTTDFQTEAVYSPKVQMVAAVMSHIVLEKGGYYA